jgi:diguanylate cyclase (GGDEF)-like protein/PAS domain S-box-containing protein
MYPLYILETLSLDNTEKRVNITFYFFFADISKIDKINDRISKIMFARLKENKESMIENLLQEFPLPMFYRTSAKKSFITNRAFDDFAGINRKKILNQLSSLNLSKDNKFEITLTNDIGKEIQTITYASEADSGMLGVIVDISDQIEAKRSILALKERYEIATKGSNEGLWEWDILNKKVHYSVKFIEILGSGAKSLEPKIESWLNRIDPRDKKMVLSELESHLRGESENFEVTHRVKSEGVTKWVTVTGKATYDSKNRPVKITGFIADVTKIKEAQEALRASEEQFSLFMKNLPAGAFIKDDKGVFVFANNYIHKLLGVDNLIGKNYTDVISPDSLEKLRESDKRTLERGVDTIEDKIVSSDGEEKYFHIHKFLIHKDNRDYIGGIYSDITEQKNTQTKLNILAHYDVLTKLPNRMMFHDELKKLISKANRNKTKIALMFIDLDNFKMINDTLGHDYGDILLQEVSKRLKSTLRAEDVVSRIGGDEFTVILDDIKDTTYPSIVAQKIIDVLSKPVKLKDEIGYIGASIGISIFPDDASEIDKLIKNADLAMYKAKHEGKNIYRYFTEDMNADASEKLALTNDLRSAIENNQLKLYYQPIVDTRDNRVVSFEALLRWEHPTLGLITPSNFIHLAEEGGFMVKIGKFIINRACQKIKELQDMGYETKIAINISSKQLTQNHLEQTVKNIVQESQINPSQLELEVTESFLMDNINEVDKALSALKEIGINTSIDDFGTGYSSLSRLKKLSISKLKIDKSFIDDIPHDEDDMVITEMIITLAKQLGLDLVAEGVETKEQKEFLESKGCFLMQGYLFSEAVDDNNLLRLLKN